MLLGTTTLERDAALRYWPERHELESEHGEIRWWWLLVDTLTGDYLEGMRWNTRDAALAVARELGEGGAS